MSATMVEEFNPLAALLPLDIGRHSSHYAWLEYDIQFRKDLQASADRGDKQRLMAIHVVLVKTALNY